MKQTKLSLLIAILIQTTLNPANFSYIHILKPQLNTKDNKSSYVWQKSIPNHFTELIPSWNAIRPTRGKLSFFVSLKHSRWSPWKKIAEWEANGQQTFSNAKDPFVHTKHVRVEMQRGRKANAFRIKVLAEQGASIKNLKALFANTANWNLFRKIRPSHRLKSVVVKNVPRLSQWKINHHRKKDLCSPTSTSMISRYFLNRFTLRILPSTTLYAQAKQFANNVHDNSYLDIYGNWLLNTAQAYTTTHGKVFYRVQRLNSFNELHWCLTKQMPIAVSIRGYLHGGAWPYNNGHFVVVVGWNQKNRTVICVDPAFRQIKHMVRSYRINDFLRAWGKSKNLAYVPINS